MSSVRSPKEPTRMLETICGSYTPRSRGDPIRFALFVCGTVKAETGKEERSTCMTLCYSIRGESTSSIPMFSGKGAAHELGGEDPLRAPEKNPRPRRRRH